MISFAITGRGLSHGSRSSKESRDLRSPVRSQAGIKIRSFTHLRSILGDWTLWFKPCASKQEFGRVRGRIYPTSV